MLCLGQVDTIGSKLEISLHVEESNGGLRMGRLNIGI